MKLSLPVDTLDKSRPALEDLRVYDPVGNETSYLIEQTVPASKITQTSRSFQVSLNPSSTSITLETGLAQPIDGVTLETPANSFIKSVRIESSADGKRWHSIAEGQPIFRQPDGASQLRLPLQTVSCSWLRLTVDDQRSPPIPFSGARVHAATAEPVAGEILSATITERLETLGETRLTLNLGAANLDLANLQVETPEPLFTRQVMMAVPRISEDSIREEKLAKGSIYRIAVEGHAPSANLILPVETQVRSRELLLLIKNDDSPPLPISSVQAERRPVYVLFFARQAGTHHLLTGNGRCAGPRYDLPGLSGSLRTASVSASKLSPILPNPKYRAPEVLPGIQEDGAAIDLSVWRFRRAVKVVRPGPQQIELDLGVLSHTQPGFQDLRVVRNGKQLPYILDRTSINRSLLPSVSSLKEAKEPKLSRWAIQLSYPSLPVTRLYCRARTSIFERTMTLWEEISDQRGEKFRRTLGEVLWIQTPQRPGKELTLMLEARPNTDTLFLETHNGDNPPIELENFQLFYSATRLLFKAAVQEEIFLYYGNERAPLPRYDLSLVAGELLAADKAPASLGLEDQLRPGRTDPRKLGKGGAVFWGSLALVVVGLLIVISRLLPKPAEPPN